MTYGILVGPNDGGRYSITTAEALEASRHADRFDILEEILEHCRNEARSPNPDHASAYEDLATRLQVIYDGWWDTL